MASANSLPWLWKANLGEICSDSYAVNLVYQFKKCSLGFHSPWNAYYSLQDLSQMPLSQNALPDEPRQKESLISKLRARPYP